MVFPQQLVYLFLIASAEAAPVATNLAEAADADSAECLLQNQFVNDKQLSAGEDSLRTSLAGSKMALFEVSSLEEAQRTSHDRRHEFKAHSFLLRRALASLSENISNDLMFQASLDTSDSDDQTFQASLNTSDSDDELSQVDASLNTSDSDDQLSQVDARGLFGEKEEDGDFGDLGAGCCSNRKPKTMPFKGKVADLDACKAKCQSMDNCGAIEYGWKNSKWCTVIPKGTDCSKLAAGPKDCGSGGGNNGVHTYELLEKTTEGPLKEEEEPAEEAPAEEEPAAEEGTVSKVKLVSGAYSCKKTGAKCVKKTLWVEPGITEQKGTGLERSVIGVTCCDKKGVGSRKPCKSGVTYDDAKSLCESRGLQLCSAEQIMAGSGEATGCKFDHGLVWTSTVQYEASTTETTTSAPVDDEPGSMVADPDNDGKKCQYNPGSFRTFKFTGRKASLETCTKACTDNPACVTFSAIFGQWCIGCKQALSDNHSGAKAFKKGDASETKEISAENPYGADLGAEEPEEAAEETEDFPDLGAGCCANRDPSAFAFKGMVADLDACKAKCQSLDDCGHIEYGWKGSKWCTVIPAGTDCGTLAAGPKDCGSGGGDNGVHTYQFLTAPSEAEPVPEQCEKFAFKDNEFVRNTPTEVPGASATSVKNVFVSHAGVMNGAYVLRSGKKVDSVRRKKGTKNQFLMGIYDDRFAKMVEVTLGLKSDGKVTATVTGARYQQTTPAATKVAFSTSDKMTKFWNTGRGQHIARSDRERGYGIKGLQIKSCLENADAVKAGREMDDLIDDFIDAQAGSEDACHSQLLEARHQLNQLHALVADLARQVNATEEQIMVYDKMLEQRLQEMSELATWKDQELEKCKIQKIKAINMFGKLKTELDEMHSIASPGVSMDVKNGKLHQASLAQMMNRHLTVKINAGGGEDQGYEELSALQRELAAHLAPASGHVIVSARMPPAHDEKKISGLIADTQQASQAFQSCMQSVNAPNGALSLFSEGPPKPKSEAECQAEKDALEKTYIKAYVELSRLKAEYEELANSTACVDSTLEQYKNRKTPLQKEADKLATAINEKVQELQSLRPRLDGAIKSEEALRKQVQKLTKQCDNLGPTVSDLNKVRDAIKALSACPGLSRVKFSLPKWIGTWATFDQDGKAKSDKQQDKQMSRACSKVVAGSRAAEVGEIQEQTVEGIPATNTAPSPLLGSCPDCEGDNDKWFQSGHSRVCWDSEAALDLANRRDNCGIGKKAILCVMDRADIRQIPGGGGGEAEKMAAAQIAAIREYSA